MRLVRFVSWALLLAMFAYALANYGAMPERIPTHMTLDGTIDGTAGRSVLTVLALPGAALLIRLLFVLLVRLLPRKPDMVNIPDKELLVALPSRYREPVIAEVAFSLECAALVVVATFALIQWEFTRAALAGVAKGSSVVMLLLPMLGTLALLLTIPRITTALDQAVKRWKEAGSPTE